MTDMQKVRVNNTVERYKLEGTKKGSIRIECFVVFAKHVFMFVQLIPPPDPGVS